MSLASRDPEWGEPSRRVGGLRARIASLPESGRSPRRWRLGPRTVRWHRHWQWPSGQSNATWLTSTRSWASIPAPNSRCSPDQPRR